MRILFLLILSVLHSCQSIIDKKTITYCPGKTCIVSTFRIQHPNSKTHFMRLKKVAIHEFGHNLGLPHCPDKTCVMTDAVESVKTIDNAKLALCNNCKLKLN